MGHFEEARRIRDQLKDKSGLAYVYFCMGKVAFSESERTDLTTAAKEALQTFAQQRCQQSLELREEMKDPNGQAYALDGLGHIAQAQ